MYGKTCWEKNLETVQESVSTALNNKTIILQLNGMCPCDQRQIKKNRRLRPHLAGIAISGPGAKENKIEWSEFSNRSGKGIGGCQCVRSG
jgi:hypothetical protein